MTRIKRVERRPVRCRPGDSTSLTEPEANQTRKGMCCLGHPEAGREGGSRRWTRRMRPGPSPACGCTPEPPAAPRCPLSYRTSSCRRRRSRTAAAAAVPVAAILPNGPRLVQPGMPSRVSSLKGGHVLDLRGRGLHSPNPAPSDLGGAGVRGAHPPGRSPLKRQARYSERPDSARTRPAGGGSVHPAPVARVGSGGSNASRPAPIASSAADSKACLEMAPPVIGLIAGVWGGGGPAKILERRAARRGSAEVPPVEDDGAGLDLPQWGGGGDGIGVRGRE